MWHQPSYTNRLAEILKLRRRSSQLPSMTKMPSLDLCGASLGMLELLSCDTVLAVWFRMLRCPNAVAIW